MDGITATITTFEFVIIGLYFAIVLAIGIYVSQKTETGEDLFLAGADAHMGRHRVLAVRLEHIQHHPHRPPRRCL